LAAQPRKQGGAGAVQGQLIKLGEVQNTPPLNTKTGYNKSWFIPLDLRDKDIFLELAL